MKKSTKVIWSAAIASLMLTACPAYGPGPDEVVCYYGPAPYFDESDDYIEQIAKENSKKNVVFDDKSENKEIK